MSVEAEVDVRVFLSCSPPCYLRQSHSGELRAHDLPSKLACSRSTLSLPSDRWDYRGSRVRLTAAGSRDLNSTLHACMATALFSEPPSL